jgi:hypothetical protein
MWIGSVVLYRLMDVPPLSDRINPEVAEAMTLNEHAAPGVSGITGRRPQKLRLVALVNIGV